MEETYSLELNFESQDGKNKKLTIRKPVENLTEEEVLPAMQVIVDNDIFSADGIDEYAAPKNAKYVRRTVEEIYDAVEE